MRFTGATVRHRFAGNKWWWKNKQSHDKWTLPSI